MALWTQGGKGRVGQTGRVKMTCGHRHGHICVAMCKAENRREAWPTLPSAGAQLCDDLEGGGMRGCEGRCKKEGMHVCQMADSLPCIAVTSITL